MIASYPKIYNLGHKAIQSLFADPVICEEKIDGSQFSFSRQDGVLHCRSKNVELDVTNPDGMFKLGIETALGLAPHLIDNWTYRGEFLAKPKHNTLAYDRVPNGNIILFDIQTGPESYLTRDEKEAEAARLGLQCVPAFYYGVITDLSMLHDFMDRVSVLGGQKIEGVVFKNYHRFGIDGKALMGKHVSEVFKETHKGDWKDRNPSRGDIMQQLIASYRTPARWAKAAQHLRDDGKLENSPRDIGLLIKEVQRDIIEECGEEIAARLLDWARPQLSKGVVAGCPEWYKEQLAASQFGGEFGGDK